MPVDYQQIHQKIRSIGNEVRDRQNFIEKQRGLGWNLLQENAANLDRLRDKVERVVGGFDPNLRCALPGKSGLNNGFVSAAKIDRATLIAVDGSQIVPDRHEAVIYGLVNVGAVIMRVNSGEAPEVSAESELLFSDEEIRNRDGSVKDEGAIALIRDGRERTKLLELASKFPAPVLTLTDGPVELWGAKDPANAESYQKFLQKYLQDLRKLNAIGVTLAGYVDKPAADLVIRLLEIWVASDEDLKKVREYHPLLGATDRWMFGKLLGPEERSSVFGLQSSSRASYRDSLAVHFFYLNVGSAGHPSVARVEIPQWVAEDDEKLNLLHTILIQQSKLLGARPYPYILHRAHETARVSRDEKEQINMMLAIELREQGGEMDEPSNKSVAKGHSTQKTRYGK
ncbi:MAG TPA: DNA double-strand break repair nuclease NurA [Anaerolineales bacterium]|nr:DNA double-strand break repair nuclease NurA [Anaerolineales bacterium]